LSSGSNTEGDTRTLELETVDYELSDLEELDLDPQPPSLGLLDGVLSFIAAERARWTAQREADVIANEEAWEHVVGASRLHLESCQIELADPVGPRINFARGSRNKHTR
jgi:hypothetical protein